MTATKKQTVIDRIEKYLSNYITFSDPCYSLPAALWIAATHAWQSFDCFPYVCITSLTKQAGKTTLANLIDFSCHEPHSITAMTPAAMFHMIEEKKPVIICDEAEFLNSESVTFMRSTLNMGYRRGSKVERIGDGGKIREYDVYCPKVFVLIGDVYDTLRDRSIIIRMKRAKAPQRFVFKTVKSEGHDLAAELRETMTEQKGEIEKVYHDFPGLLFMSGRDEEIWIPLFVICSVLCPERLTELTRNAVDIATDKTSEAISYKQNRDAEQRAEDDFYSTSLLRNVLEVIPALSKQARSETKKRTSKQGNKPKMAKRVLYPDALLTALKDMPTAPWRKYRHDGLSRDMMADLLGSIGVKTIAWRVDSKPVRVYDVEAIERRAKEVGISIEEKES